MKLPANYADVRMEQLLQRIRTSFEMEKDEASKRTIIVLLRSVSDVIQNSIRAKGLETSDSKSLRKRIAAQSGGSSTTITSKSLDNSQDT